MRFGCAYAVRVRAFTGHGNVTAANYSAARAAMLRRTPPDFDPGLAVHAARLRRDAMPLVPLVPVSVGSGGNGNGSGGGGGGGDDDFASLVPAGESAAAAYTPEHSLQCCQLKCAVGFRQPEPQADCALGCALWLRTSSLNTDSTFWHSRLRSKCRADCSQARLWRALENASPVHKAPFAAGASALPEGRHSAFSYWTQSRLGKLGGGAGLQPADESACRAGCDRFFDCMGWSEEPEALALVPVGVGVSSSPGGSGVEDSPADGSVVPVGVGLVPAGVVGITEEGGSS